MFERFRLLTSWFWISCEFVVLRLRRSHVLRGSIPGQFMSFFSLWAYLKHGYVLSGSSVSACCVVLVYKAVYTCGFWYTLVHTWVTF